MSTSVPKTAWHRRSHTPAAIVAITAVIAMAAWAPATLAVNSAARSVGSGAPTVASVLRPLTPQERRYVLGIAALTPLQLWAAFGTTLTPPRPGRMGSTPTTPMTSSSVKNLPILPACGPGPCWHAAAPGASRA